jgi:hypothetical protein
MTDDGIVWFEFDEAEAVGVVGVRRDSYGLGLYLREHPDPKQRDGTPFQIGTVDLFYASPEGQACHEEATPPVHLVINDTASDELVATARFLPSGTVIELEREEQFTFQRPHPHLLLVSRKPPEEE